VLGRTNRKEETMNEKEKAEFWNYSVAVLNNLLKYSVNHKLDANCLFFLKKQFEELQTIKKEELIKALEEEGIIRIDGERIFNRCSINEEITIEINKIGDKL